MSRSISSAINRRAGNNAPRPSVPTNQQPSYNPKISQVPGPGQQAPKNVRFVPSGQGQPGQQPQPVQRRAFQEPTIPVKTAGVNGPVGQVSISDAFALVTIRLGRVEQFVQQVQEEGIPSSSDNTNDNQLQFDTDLKHLHNMFQSQQDTIHALTQKIEKYENTFLQYDKEMKDLKDIVLTITMKNDKNSIETSNVLSKFESTVKTTEYNINTVDENLKGVIKNVITIVEGLKNTKNNMDEKYNLLQNQINNITTNPSEEVKELETVESVEEVKELETVESVEEVKEVETIESVEEVKEVETVENA